MNHLTWSIKKYIDRNNSNLTVYYHKTVYRSCNDLIYLHLLGMRSGVYKEMFGIKARDSLRRNLSKELISKIEFIEESASTLIDKNVEPVTAICLSLQALK